MAEVDSRPLQFTLKYVFHKMCSAHWKRLITQALPFQRTRQIITSDRKKHELVIMAYKYRQHQLMRLFKDLSLINHSDKNQSVNAHRCTLLNLEDTYRSMTFQSYLELVLEEEPSPAKDPFLKWLHERSAVK